MFATVHPLMFLGGKLPSDCVSSSGQGPERQKHPGCPYSEHGCAEVDLCSSHRTVDVWKTHSVSLHFKKKIAILGLNPRHVH